MKKIEIATPDLNRVSARDVFACCPRCKDKDLISCDGDVICTGCGWDSIALSVESQISAHCARYQAERENGQAANTKSNTPRIRTRSSQICNLPTYSGAPGLCL